MVIEVSAKSSKIVLKRSPAQKPPTFEKSAATMSPVRGYQDGSQISIRWRPE